MDEGESPPNKRDPKHPLNVPGNVDVRRDRPTPETARLPTEALHPGDASDVRRDRPTGGAAKPSGQHLHPGDAHEVKRDRSTPTRTAPETLHPGEPHQVRKDRGEARPGASPFLPPSEFEEHRPRTRHVPTPRTAAPEQYQSRPDKHTGNSHDNRELASGGPVEVRHDQPLPKTTAPLPTSAGDIEIQSDAGRQRVRVMTTGVFDLIHIGHLRMLEAARRLGDELVVVIARDETVRKMKHEPLNAEDVRRQIVEGLKPVSKAVLGRHGDIYSILAEIRPDIIALGYDQRFTEDEVRRRCQSMGLEIQVLRLPEFEHELDATRKIIDRIADRLQRNELYRPRGA